MRPLSNLSADDDDADVNLVEQNFKIVLQTEIFGGCYRPAPEMEQSY